MEKETNNINGGMYEKKYVLKKINKIGNMYCQSLKDYLRFYTKRVNTYNRLRRKIEVPIK